jgi:hypothetical protein
MKHVRISYFFNFVLSFALLVAPLPLSAATENITQLLSEDEQQILAESPDRYIYLGQSVSDIIPIIESIKNLDDKENSPLKEFNNHIKNGLFLGEYDTVLEVLDYADAVLQRHYDSANEQVQVLIEKFEDLANKIINDELTIDGATRAFDPLPCPHPILTTAQITQNLFVCGKTTLRKHLNTKEGAHIQGKLKVDGRATFKSNVKVDGILSAEEAIIDVLSAVDASIDSLSATAATIESLSVVEATIDSISVIDAVIDSLSVTDLAVAN